MLPHLRFSVSFPFPRIRASFLLHLAHSSISPPFGGLLPSLFSLSSTSAFDLSRLREECVEEREGSFTSDLLALISGRLFLYSTLGLPRYRRYDITRASRSRNRQVLNVLLEKSASATSTRDDTDIERVSLKKKYESYALL